MKHDILICDCSHPEHQMIVASAGNEVYIMMHLKRLSFWKRLWEGILYICGKQSEFGAFEEIILNKEHIPKLKEVIKTLENGNIS